MTSVQPAPPTRDEVFAAATRHYLRGEPLDMSALASELGIGRATLYRWVGGREELLAVVLAEATHRTFAAARRDGRGSGRELVVDVCTRFMRAAVEAEPLRALTDREPLLYLRLATTPGQIEQAAAHGVRRLLEDERAAGRLRLAASPELLAGAIVRICDGHVYAHLLGRGTPDIDTAVQLLELLLRE